LGGAGAALDRHRRRAPGGACVEFARAAGYRRMVLWTDKFLTRARRLYAAAGFHLVSAETQVAFGHENVAEDWQLDFAGWPQIRPPGESQCDARTFPSAPIRYGGRIG
jgi:hypothetical protein